MPKEPNHWHVSQMCLGEGNREPSSTGTARGVLGKTGASAALDKPGYRC